MCVTNFKPLTSSSNTEYVGYKVFRKFPKTKKLRGMTFTICGGYEMGNEYRETLDRHPDLSYKPGFHIFKTKAGAKTFALTKNDVIVKVICKNPVGTGIFGKQETGIFRTMKLIESV